MTEVKLNKHLEKDALGVANSIYRMNAPRSKGYLFHEDTTGKKVAVGMFCDSKEEINNNEWTEWTYYLDFSTNKFYKI